MIRRLTRALITVFALLLAVAALPAGAATREPSAAGCPAVARCGLYSLTPGRWRSVRGAITIHYRLSPATPFLTPDKVVLAVQAAARTWEMANPAIHLILDGTTNDLPQLGDGVNQIAFVPTMEPDVLAETNRRAKGGRQVEADTLLNITKAWGWSECAGKSRCDDASATTLTPSLRLMDIQAVVTQQMGRWLSLDGLASPAAQDLTMFEPIAYGERHKATLGLGDILGVRAAYPCGRCARPAVVSP